MRALLVGLAVLSLGGCQLNSFDSTLVGETTLAGGDAGTPLTAIPAFGSFNALDFSQNPDFENNDVSPSDLNSAKVTSLTLKIISPSDQDFSFLDDVQFFAHTGDALTLVAERHDIASLPLDGPNPTLSLNVTGADLTPYVSGGAMTLEIRATGRAPRSDTRLRATVGFEFRVKVF